ncbi:MAG TPA: ABC transporter ATP-binding protein [Bryobacteraceae bacterium]|nr:ABC transporter ATP-binding protein [Bryobacteraceae bacterium]
MRVLCSGLGVSFDSPPGKVQALSNLTFETREGEFLAVLGPSGCGKTTLLKVIAGLLPPSRGTIQCIPAAGRLHRALMVSQENNLFPWMTVLQNSTFGLEMAKVPKQERRAHALELLSRFGMAGWESFYPGELSLGMKQRVAVIRGFLSHPSLLLMDEPFSALDAQTRLTLQQELLGLWEQSQKSVIFVTHDVDEAILLSDRILVLGHRPGAVIGSFNIPFPRPRDRSITLDDEFLLLKRAIWAKLGLDVRTGVTYC